MIPEVPLPIVVAIVATLLLVGGLLAWRRGRRARAPVRYVPHARERMRERVVAEAEVRRTLSRPDREHPVTYLDRGASAAEERDSIRLEKDFPGRTLKVWVPPDWRTHPEIVVKSVAWQYVATVRVARSRVGRVIGRAGQTVRDIERGCEVRIAVDRRTGIVRIVGDERVLVDAAVRRVRALDRPGAKST